MSCGWGAGGGSLPDRPSRKTYRAKDGSKTQVTNHRAGPTLSAGEVRLAAVLGRMGHPQGAGSVVLTERRIASGKRAGHVQLHHPIVRR